MLEMMKRVIYILMFLLLGLTVYGQNEHTAQDIMLSNYSYPYEVKYLNFKSQNQDLKMAYMIVEPKYPNGKTVVLLHGKNFNGAYWRTTIEALISNGFRVVAPDQIGFGKSSKPLLYQFTLQQLALNTKSLLNQLNITKIYLIGHSLGGMIAIRFALMYPETVEKLVLENPLGLEDWKLVAPYTTIDRNYEKELKSNYESAKQYQSESYYDNKWKPEYDEWVYLNTAWVTSPDYPLVAMNNAQTSDMIFTQPVVYEFKNIKTQTLLVIGTRDRTAIGKNTVEDLTVRKEMGQYQILGKKAQKEIPGASLVELDNVGHLPHIEAFVRFIQPVLKFFKN